MASNDNGATDRRNATLNYLPSDNGVYYIEVSSTGGTKGEYVLSVEGTTVTRPPFAVASNNPADGTRLRGPLTEYTVDFNDLDPVDHALGRQHDIQRTPSDRA